MNILYIHGLFFHHRTWAKAAKALAAVGIRLTFAEQMSAAPQLAQDKASDIDFLLADLALGLPGYDEVAAAGRRIPHRLGLTPEMDREFTSMPQDVVAECMVYLRHVSAANYENGVRFLAAKAGMAVSFLPPVPVPPVGIYHPEAQGFFTDGESYRIWHTGRVREESGSWIGVLIFYSQLVEENTADVDRLLLCLESYGLAPICLFFSGIEDLGEEGAGEPPWLVFLRRQLPVEILLNLTAGSLQKTGDLRQNHLARLNVPIIQLLRAHGQTPDEWRDDPQGLPAMTAVYSLAQPETCGVIAPILVAGSGPDEAFGGNQRRRTFIPINERIDTLCRRVRRLVRLRRLANNEKNITIVLHNNPCKGVEATVGLAAGLDTFASLSALLSAMGEEGYDIGEAPRDGRGLQADILDHKAISEFRWTTVDEILAKGGDLALVKRSEYQQWFATLPETARNKVVADWGEFPGQGMVTSENGEPAVLVTGRKYGKIRVMVQPKRGCYGAKCTGEVCRILHDPALAPPHHWLATYKYIQDHSDAVIHFGTEGALEFLPGKQLALSDACFPEISIGDLPNFYVYIMDATGEGLLAKRRGQAVLIDHLPPIHRPAPLDAEMLRLDDLLRQYQRAEEGRENARKELLAKELTDLFLTLHLADGPVEPADFSGLVDRARRQLELMQRAMVGEGLHLLGTPPDSAATGRMLATLLRTPPPGLADTVAIASGLPGGEGDAWETAARYLACLACGKEAGTDEDAQGALVAFCRETAKRLTHCRDEIANLLAALSGRFVPPGLSGSLSRGRTDLLPTGRNFFAVDVTTLPTPAAWEIGEGMAKKVLTKYYLEEGRFPESIGISIWSTDAFKADGELLCQTLALMGTRPVWHPSGRVEAVEAITLDELLLALPDGRILPRPRVDVTVQTSSIMRDMVPCFCRLLDQAVSLVSFLEEDQSRNFLAKHTREQMAKLRERTDQSLSDSDLRRLATLRIFSSSPGTYGVGIGLALDASAWHSRDDLAEVYVNWSGFAYGYDPAHGAGRGIEARQLLADHLARIEVSYMQQASAEYDLLDCGCYAVSQGGMALAATAVGKSTPKLYWGDATSPDHAEVRETAVEIERLVRAKLVNQRWIDDLHKHGYKGTQEISNRINTLFKWSATTGKVPKRLFDAVVATYFDNQWNYQWLRRENPFALEEITRRLLEAASRQLWQADETTLARVQAAALAIEGDMEECMGDVQEEFQGGKVEVFTAADVEKWQPSWRLKEYRQ